MSPMLHFLTKDPEAEWEKTVFAWPLLSSPTPTIVLVFLFLYFIKVLGPRLMKDRKPFQIKPLIFAYNVATVLLNLYMFVNFGLLGWFTDYSLSCQPLDPSPRSNRMNWICYLYFLSKFYDFADTIFFVLTKKDSHITFLHVIHHASMPFNCWLGMRLGPNGHGTFAPMLNSFVHVVMYSYYALALLGPSVRPYLWWKRYLTQMQLLQFFLIFVHSSQLVFNHCNYPIQSFYIYAFLMTMFIVLFANFYIQSYLKTKEGRSRDRMAMQAASTANGKSLMQDSNGNLVSNGGSNGSCSVNGKKTH